MKDFVIIKRYSWSKARLKNTKEPNPHPLNSLKLNTHYLKSSLSYWYVLQVVKRMLALNNDDFSVQIDGHDTLWGETGL